MSVCSLLLLMVVVVSGCRQVAGGRADGAEVFRSVCAGCHGPAGVPEPAMRARLGVKDLSDPKLHQRLSDQQIREQIQNGSEDKRMPAFTGALTPAQVEAVIVYIRGLQLDGSRR